MNKSTRYQEAKTILENDGFLELTKATTDSLLIKRIYNSYGRFVKNTQLNKLINDLRFDLPADPYKVIWVNNEKIKYCFRPPHSSKMHGLAQIKGGDWNPTELWCENNPIYSGLNERFKQNRSWEDTEYVRWAEKRIKTKGEAYGHSKIEDFIDNRCDFLDDLYLSMKKKRMGSQEKRNEKTKSRQYGTFNRKKLRFSVSKYRTSYSD